MSENYPGQRYEALVPDTLDLQERAELGINGLTGPTDPEANYDIYWRASLNRNPPVMGHDSNDHVIVKFWEALPLLRIVCGSEQNRQVEQSWKGEMLRMQAEDGLMYWETDKKPWFIPPNPFPHAGLDFVPEGRFMPVFMMGRLLGACSAYHILEPDNGWGDAVRKATDALDPLIARNGRDAYVSISMVELGRPRRKNDHVPMHYEAGCAGWLAQGLVHAYRSLGYEPAAEMARGLMEHVAFRSGFFEADGTFGPDKLMEPEEQRHIDRVFVYTPERAAHFHAHTTQVMAILDYIEASGDTRMLEFAKNAYDYGKSRGEPLTGYFPEYLDGRPYAETAETCQIADMIVCAVMLARLGVDSCWDDVDRWVRNQFAENQMMRSDWVYRMAEQLPFVPTEECPTLTTDHVAERNVGAFAGWPSPNDFLSWNLREMQHIGCGIMHCCTGNGTRAIYYVWHDILGCQDGKLKVNLLLNRASQWADVDSHIPYVGQVDVRLKQPMREVAIRTPEWVKPADVRCQVGGTERLLRWEGRYALCGEAAPGQVVTLTFPIEEKSGHIWIEKTRYNMVFKGNEVVHVDPAGTNCPLFQREHYRVNGTRWRKIERYVSDTTIDW